jgi:hypothetical protein
MSVVCFCQRKEKIQQAKAAQEKKKADYKAGRAFGVSYTGVQG